MINLGEIAKQLRKQKKMTLQAVAALMDDSYDAGNLSRFERGEQDITRARLEKLAKALGTTVKNMLELSESNENNSQSTQSGYVNLAKNNREFGTVPLISWMQAGMLNQCKEKFEDCEQIIAECEIKNHTFALRVQGDSMAASGPVSFPEGIIIIVEPDMEAKPNDFVIAKNGSNEATFKQLIKDGNDWYLKPLNDRYPIKPLGDSTIVGVVRQATIKFR